MWRVDFNRTIGIGRTVSRKKNHTYKIVCTLSREFCVRKTLFPKVTWNKNTSIKKSNTHALEAAVGFAAVRSIQNKYSVETETKRTKLNGLNSWKGRCQTKLMVLCARLAVVSSWKHHRRPCRIKKSINDIRMVMVNSHTLNKLFVCHWRRRFFHGFRPFLIFFLFRQHGFPTVCSVGLRKQQCAQQNPKT